MSSTKGAGFFRRLKADHDIHFLRNDQVHKYVNEEITLKVWADDTQRYIRENNMGHLCYSPKSIFIIEANVLVWSGSKCMAFKVAVSTEMFRTFSM